jgi:hypothetical protein
MAETPDRYCGNCGRELSPEDQFCRNCGRPVHQAARVPTPEADVPVPPPQQAGGAGGGDAAAWQAPPQEGEGRRRLMLGWLSIIGLFAFLAIVVGGIASIAGGGGGGGNGDGAGKVAEKPKQERQAAQQEQPQKKEPQPQKEEQQAQGEQQDGGGQEPEPQKPDPQQPSFASFGDGTYQVGADIPPGTYRTRAGSPNCYWERLRNFSGGMNGVLANGGTSAPGIVTIEPTDVGFHSEGCETWTKDLSAITTSKTSFGAGAYIVGTDMEPGTYRNSGGRNCYWERLRGFNGGMNAIIANGGSNNPSIVTIAPTDAGFQSKGCGTWTKLE